MDEEVADLLRIGGEGNNDEGREEESLIESLERREESSLTNEPRGDDNAAHHHHVAAEETALRLLELTSTTARINDYHLDEEERDGCASLVSFTSSLYSDPVAAQNAAILLSRINTNTNHINNNNNNAPRREVRINQVNITNNSNIMEGRAHAEARELPPDGNLLSTDEDDDDNNVENAVEQTQSQRPAPAPAPPIPSSLEIVTKEDEAFTFDLSRKSQPWVAMKYPKRFVQYWKESERDELILTLQGVTYPDDIIQAARDIDLYADICMLPETIIPIDNVDTINNGMMKRSVKVVVNNGDRTMVIARSSKVGEIVLEEANAKIRSLLQEKEIHFLKSYHIDKHKNKKYDFILQPIDNNNNNINISKMNINSSHGNYPYGTDEQNVLLSKTMDFIQELSSRKIRHKSNSTNPEYDVKVSKNNLIDNCDNPEIDVINNAKNKGANNYECNDSTTSSTATSNNDNEPINFGSIFGENFKFLLSCTQPICACSVPGGGMCYSPEI